MGYLRFSVLAAVVVTTVDDSLLGGSEVGEIWDLCGIDHDAGAEHGADRVQHDSMFDAMGCNFWVWRGSYIGTKIVLMFVDRTWGSC